MCSALLLTTTATVLLTTSSSYADEVPLGGCAGIEDFCSGQIDLTYRCGNEKFQTTSCHTTLTAAEISWYIDDFLIDTTSTKRCNSGVPSRWSPKPPVVFKYCLIDSYSIAISVSATICRTAVHNVSCVAINSTGSFLVKKYSACLLSDEADFQNLPVIDNFLQNETFYTKPGDIIGMNCTYSFEPPQTAYNYSITWTRNFTAVGDVANASISCTSLGGHTYSSSLLVTAGNEDAQYLCVIAKSDLQKPWRSSTLFKHFYLISVPPRQILTYPQIAGVSASVLLALLAIEYVVWRFLIPLQSRLHHTCNYGRRMRAGGASYDAIVLFDDSCSLTSSFTYDLLLPKVEGEWCYRLCLPQRDFTPGEDMATQIIEMVEKSLMCVFLMDDRFFDCRWCECALQHALKYPGKAICVLFLSQDVVRQWKTRLSRIAKVGTVINWKANETASKFLLKKIFIPCDNWIILKKHLPPNKHLSCC